MRKFASLLVLSALLLSCEKKPEYIVPVLPPDDPAPETPSGSTGLDFSVVQQELSQSIVLTFGNTLRYQSVMQSFALSGDGYMYGIQVGTSTNKYLLNVTRKPVTGDSGKTYMQLPFAGHGSNMEVERSGGKDYIWTGSYGTWNGTKYTNSQTVARIPFSQGSKLTPQECAEQYWVPGLRNVAPAIDLDSDLLLIWGLANGESETGYFKGYRLSEAKALTASQVKLERSITYGGQDSGYPEVTETPTVNARNLGALTPVINIRLNGGALGTGSNQGFEIYGDYILHLSGPGNDDTPGKPSVATLTVLDLKGTVLGRYNVGALSSIEALTLAGITDTGFMEAEGVKIYDDVLYLGFATKHSSDEKRMVTIFKYNIKK
ncbi:MAG: hypothetical protein IJU68_04120 [Bacteroidales bacterium]|nr:hypothetical protein [Bacteroidales bacterium]